MVKKRRRTARTKPMSKNKASLPSKKNRHSVILWICIILLVLVVFLQMKGTEPEEKEVIGLQCAPPYILNNGQCCLDTDDNGYCDNQEQPTTQPARPVYEESTYAPPLKSFFVKSVSAFSGSKPVLLGGRVTNDDDPFMGNINAPLMIIEFGNYDCVPCKESYKHIFQKIQSKYVSTGHASYVFRDFAIGAEASSSAVVAYCAREQGKFWEMHHKLQLDSRRYTRQEYIEFAKELNLDISTFNICIDGDEALKEQEKDYKDGRAATMKSGVPVFFVNGFKVTTVDYDLLEQTIENVHNGVWE